MRPGLPIPCEIVFVAIILGQRTRRAEKIPKERRRDRVSARAERCIPTTFAEMFELEPNTYIIDTPGIKELGMIDMEDWEISHYFPEMRQLLGECKFNNCLHVSEPGCVVLNAMVNGVIHESRYMSYLSMLDNDDNRR